MPDFFLIEPDQLEGFALIIWIVFYAVAFVSSVGYIVLPWFVFWRLNRIQRAIEEQGKTQNPFK